MATARSLDWVVEHWITLAAGFLLAFAALPSTEPLLRAAGAIGVADPVFGAYGWVCHQMPSRSYFIAGQQMAYCQRNTAIYGTAAVAGLLWPRYRFEIHWPAFVLLGLPMALDGFTQMFGLRESTWELRTATGTLFGAACVWFSFPLIERCVRRQRP